MQLFLHTLLGQHRYQHISSYSNIRHKTSFSFSLLFLLKPFTNTQTAMSNNITDHRVYVHMYSHIRYTYLYVDVHPYLKHTQFKNKGNQIKLNLMFSRKKKI